MSKHEGSCGCGVVEFKLNSEVLNIVNCHCNMCRSHNGSPFSTYAVLPFNAFEITNGIDDTEKYTVGSGTKHFCKRCGTPLFNVNEKYPGACMIYLGTLNSSNDLVPKVNVWCESKMAWVDSLSDITSLSKGIERKNENT